MSDADRYHRHHFDNQVVAVHRHPGDDAPHTHAGIRADGSLRMTVEADGRRTPGEVTPVEDTVGPWPRRFCLAHSQYEPCSTCGAYIAAGL